ncbi:MAG: hypothetical protein C4323_12635 [Mastigocladus sp. ERB_26_2]
MVAIGKTCTSRGLGLVIGIYVRGGIRRWGDGGMGGLGEIFSPPPHLPTYAFSRVQGYMLVIVAYLTMANCC